VGPFDSWIGVLTFGTALGCGLIAGAFFAFSTFVMRALARLPAAQGIAAMNSINVAVITPSFMVALFGTGGACVVLAGVSLFTWSSPGAGYLFAGSALYVVGTILVTIIFNVPRNDALAVVDAASSDGAALWTSYLRSWTAWNHVRTIAAAGAAAALILALCLPRSAGAS
jgi:uncharacterized membrane protein